MDRPSRTLLGVGSGLLWCALIVGLVVPAFPDARRAVSTHVLGIVQGLLLIVLGLAWAHLHVRLARAAAALVIYGSLAAWVANLLAAIWRAGGGTFPLAAVRGTAAQELVIAIALRSSAIALVAGVGIVVVSVWMRVSASDGGRSAPGDAGPARATGAASTR